jgi:glycerophosphoryl diester phosphodiesterase
MRKYKGIFIWFILMFSSFQELYSQDTVIPKSKNAFVVIAHRGDHTNAPENTITAFQNAIDAGADYVEIDLRTSKDSQLVIMHDGSVNRMTNGTGKVNEMNWNELRELKVTDKNHPDWNSESIPRFSDVLNLCKGKINTYLDFKEADVEAACREIVKAGMQHSVIVYINAEHQFYEWKKIAPNMPLMVSLPDSIRTAKQVTGFLLQYHISILDGAFNEYNNEMVNAAIANGVAVWPDIESKDEAPELWDKVLNLGFTGLQTDHPGMLIQYLKSKKIR